MSYFSRNDAIRERANRRTREQFRQQLRVNAGQAGVELLQPSPAVRNRFSNQLEYRGTWAQLLQSVISQDEYGVWVKNLKDLAHHIQESIAELQKDFFDSDATPLLDTRFEVKKTLAARVHQYFQYTLIEITLWKNILEHIKRLQTALNDYLEGYMEAARTSPSLQDVNLSRINVKDRTMAPSISSIQTSLSIIRTLQQKEAEAMVRNETVSWEKFVEGIAFYNQKQASYG